MTVSQTTSPEPDSTPAGVTAPPLRVTSSSTTSGAAWSIPSPNPADGADSSAGAEPPPDPIGNGPTPSASDKPAGPPLSLKDMARGLVLGGSVRLGQIVGKGDEAAAEQWVATPKEQGAIGDPLARVAGRHVSASAGNPDIADLIVAGIAAISYAIRAVTGMWNLKRARKTINAASVAAATEGETL